MDEGVDDGAAIAEAVEDHLDQVAGVGVDAPTVADHQVSRRKEWSGESLADRQRVEVADLVVALARGLAFCRVFCVGSAL